MNAQAEQVDQEVPGGAPGEVVDDSAKTNTAPTGDDAPAADTKSE